MRLVIHQVLRLFVVAILPGLGFAQQSRVLAWKPTIDDPSETMLYRPEPILFVHGINDNDSGWAAAIEALQPSFSGYYISRDIDDFSREQTNGLNAVQQPYLHTFNYGNYVRANLPDNAQSFDHIEWNAWEADMKSRAFTNAFLRSVSTNITVRKWQWNNDENKWDWVSETVTLPPDPEHLHPPINDNRKTLQQRIDDLRQAYRIFTNVPNNVLVAHSMGGLLSHYYLCKKEEAAQDSGVRRLVTLATPHCGSPVANDQFKSLVINPVDRIAHGANMTIWYKFARTITFGRKDPVGYTRYSAGGALEDLTVSISGGGYLAYANDLQTFFETHSVPTLEYVFNGYTMPTFTLYKTYRLFGGNAAAWSDVKIGDGVVSLKSAAGKSSNDASSIWTGQDPVVFQPWTGQDHSDANKHIPSLFASLFGVPNQWPGPPARPPVYENVIPSYARTYGENQSFGKYLPWWWGWWNENEAYWASDEPGIGDVTLLCERPQGNALVISALNTWGLTNDNVTGFNLPKKLHTAHSNLVAHQILGDPQAQLRVLALAGAKNHARIPFGMDGTNFWAVDGNEYLPASLQVRYAASTAPIDTITNPFQSGCIASTVTLLDTNDAPQFQYGLFDRAFNSTAYRPQAPNTVYFAMEATNLAGFFTPQAERGFDVPVNSATVVNLLCGINEREAAAGVGQTHWMTWVTEWIDLSPTNTTITLNFFPKDDPNTWGFWLEDAFTDTLYEDWTAYDNVSKKFTIPPPDAQRCLKVTYEAYLGGLASFTNLYEGSTNFCVVPPLTNASALAGIPATPEFVQQMKDALYRLFPRYVDHTLAAEGNFNNWLATHPTAADLPMLAATNLAGVTPNYCWDCTTNMLSGQDFVELHTASTNLQWIRFKGDWNSLGMTNTAFGVGWTNSFQANAWCASKTLAESDFQTNRWEGGDPNWIAAPHAGSYGEVADGGWGGLWSVYSSHLTRSYCSFGGNNLPLATNVSAQLYFPVFTYASPWGLTNAVFHDNGDNVLLATNAAGVMQRSFTYDGSGTNWTSIGNASLPVPTWCDEPPGSPTYGTTAKGYQAGSRAILLLKVSESFNFK